MPIDVTATLRKAFRQLEREKAVIEQQLAAIRSVLGSLSSRSGAARPVRRGRRRRMSAAARRAASQRMKAYWATRRSAKASVKKAS
jgi:hypothetical protein